MARTIDEIKKQMTDTYLADKTIRDAYGITADTSFNDAFSKVSVESIIFYIVATGIYILEVFFDLFKADVDDKISRAVVASVPWYYKISREFQYGDQLVFNEQTQEFTYPKIDESKQKIKYAAVRDAGGSVQILVSGQKDNLPEILPDAELTAFKYYINKRKMAGITVMVSSRNSDQISIDADIQINPMVMNPDGSLINNSTVFPVPDAINDYLKNIVYGGTFNKTKLVDAIQVAEGVVDVSLVACYYKADGDASFTPILDNNYVAVSGAFTAVDLTLEYAV